jgi:hypothetical protein
VLDKKDFHHLTSPVILSQSRPSQEALSNIRSTSRENFSLELWKIPWVERAGAILGRADADAHAQWSNNAEIEVALSPDVTKDEKIKIYDAINTVIGEYKQVAVWVSVNLLLIE